MNDAAAWYQSLVQPPFAPPAWVFAPVWTVLYIVMATSYGYVLWLAMRRRLPWRTVLPFALNLLFNLAFTPLQFGLRNNWLAALDIVAVLGTLLWALLVIRKHARWVTLVNLPYLAWVAFATVLQLSITWLNR
jgi:tryptophan-rich sensory protein